MMELHELHTELACVERAVGENSMGNGLDWSGALNELQDELSAMTADAEQERQRRVAEQVASVHHNAYKPDSRGLATLPSQGECSVLLHEAVVDHYAKKHNCTTRLRAEARSRKQNDRHRKKRRRAQAYQEKLGARTPLKGRSASLRRRRS